MNSVSNVLPLLLVICFDNCVMWDPPPWFVVVLAAWFVVFSVVRGNGSFLAHLPIFLVEMPGWFLEKNHIPGFLEQNQNHLLPFPKKKPARFDWNDFCARALQFEPAPVSLRLCSAPEALPPVDLGAHQRAQKELRCLGTFGWWWWWLGT